VSALKFWKSLAVVSILTLFALVALHEIEVLKPHLMLSLLSLGLMTLVAAVLFVLGKKAVESSNKYAFIRLVMVSVLTKMFLFIGLIAVYVRFVEPESKYFVIPFLIIYIVFSVFETYVLYKLAMTKSTFQDE